MILSIFFVAKAKTVKDEEVVVPTKTGRKKSDSSSTTSTVTSNVKNVDQEKSRASAASKASKAAAKAIAKAEK